MKNYYKILNEIAASFDMDQWDEQANLFTDVIDEKLNSWEGVMTGIEVESLYFDYDEIPTSKELNHACKNVYETAVKYKNTSIYKNSNFRIEKAPDNTWEGTTRIIFYFKNINSENIIEFLNFISYWIENEYRGPSTEDIGTILPLNKIMEDLRKWNKTDLLEDFQTCLDEKFWG